jgi:UDP-N-acetylmuramate dehydrogenase
VPLRPYVTLRAGGPAEWMARPRTCDDLARLAIAAQTEGIPTTYLGWGSNVLPSDVGIRGLVVLNLARRIEVRKDGKVEADAGCGFQELFLKASQSGLAGLSFAVGIPGTLGGALVSNAGAYRSNISSLLTEIEIVFEGKRQWVEPSFMGFSYRHSILRTETPPPLALVRVRMQLHPGDPKATFDEAREFQRQRISKQPPPASAGSFFKNVNDRALAESLETLPQALREAGVVPSGYLIEQAGLKGARLGGAMLSARHANFMLNVGGAAATEIRSLADLAKKAVFERFGVRLEEEVLFLGDWSGYSPV